MAVGSPSLSLCTTWSLAWVSRKFLYFYLFQPPFFFFYKFIGVHKQIFIFIFQICLEMLSNCFAALYVPILIWCHSSSLTNTTESLHVPYYIATLNRWNTLGFLPGSGHNNVVNWKHRSTLLACLCTMSWPSKLSLTLLASPDFSPLISLPVTFDPSLLPPSTFQRPPVLERDYHTLSFGAAPYA